MGTLTFKLNDKLYLKDPQATVLGQKIVQKSIEMIDALGFEHFTFKKLADQVGSTEPSIYRYFENKHRLLHYLAAWYWSWMDYRLNLVTSALATGKDRLQAAIKLITEEKKLDPSFQHINEEVLHRIMVNELYKTHFTKWVDDDNQAGLFAGLKALTTRIAGYVRQIVPDYEFPESLISTAIFASHEQMFFIQHLPALSNIGKGYSRAEQHAHLRRFVESMVFGAIGRK